MSATKAEIEELLHAENFGYQRVALPYGLSTPGHDRSETAGIAFPDSLEGKSVLDLGCAIGFFCFEAEKRGAHRVVGTDLKRKRLRHANLLKGVLSSRVDFQAVDLLSQAAPDQEFDVVLALNVLHHVPDPVTALTRLSALARERLVLEFPTFGDWKFREDNSLRLWRLYNRFPVIGVSVPRRVDQTFVYSPLAIRRLLKVHVGGFSAIEIHRSPMKGRAIVIGHK